MVNFQWAKKPFKFTAQHDGKQHIESHQYRLDRVLSLSKSMTKNISRSI